MLNILRLKISPSETIKEFKNNLEIQLKVRHVEKGVSLNINPIINMKKLSGVGFLEIVKNLKQEKTNTILDKKKLFELHVNISRKIKESKN